jgi:hypothetical protein
MSSQNVKGKTGQLGGREFSWYVEWEHSQKKRVAKV